MTALRLTLLADGPSDQALLPVLRWLVRKNSTTAFEQNWADLQRWPHRPWKLAGRVEAALDLYPCDLLVVHRDAEGEPPENRLREIAEATQGRTLAVACAVPVRMTEAWLLFDESAIRRAAGCPNGTMPLTLPAMRNAEFVAAKEVLNEALTVASDRSGRRRKQFRPDIRRLSELIDDFAPLRVLQSFRAFEESLCHALRRLGILGNGG